MINGSALNIGTINGTGGNRVIEALAAIDALSECDAAAWALCLPTSTVGASANVSLVQTSITQRHASLAVIRAVADMLAGIPKMKYASSSAVLSSGTASVDAYKIAQPISVDMDTTCLFGAAPYIGADGKAAVATSALCSGTAFGIMQPRPEVTATAQTQAVAVRRCPSLSAVLAQATVAADGGYSIAADATLSCKANISATGGYGIPSLGMLTCRAGMYVYGKQTHQCGASISCRCNTSAVSIVGFGAFAYPVGTASAIATAIAEQGKCDDLTARAEVLATAEYWHQARVATSGVSLLTADSYVICDGRADVLGKPVVRVETQVNNELEGYSDPTAVSVLGINVNGVAVAISIAHIHAFVDIECVGEYWHKAKANAGALCVAVADGILVQQSNADATSNANVTADAHWLWFGETTGISKAVTDASANILHSIGNDDIDDSVCVAVVTCAATYGHNARSNALAVCDITDGIGGVVYIEKIGESNIDCMAECSAESIGNPDSRDQLERTMYRAYVERTMSRPFVDRAMKTTSA